MSSTTKTAVAALFAVLALAFAVVLTAATPATAHPDRVQARHF